MEDVRAELDGGPVLRAGARRMLQAVIESTFATIRHRTRRTKGADSRTATLTMVFKLALEAHKRWHRLQGYNLIPLVAQGVRFVEMDKAA